jgi:hypothetical protein
MRQCIVGRRLLGLALATVLSAIPHALMSAQNVREEKDDCLKYQKTQVPLYRVARESRTDSALTLFISIAPAQTDRDSLLALSCQLGRDHVAQDALFVWILDNYRAAKRYNPQGEGNDRSTASSFVGLYGFSRQPGGTYGQTLEWQPNRADRGSLVHIDLGPPPKKTL